MGFKSLSRNDGSDEDSTIGIGLKTLSRIDGNDEVSPIGIAFETLSIFGIICIDVVRSTQWNVQM